MTKESRWICHWRRIRIVVLESLEHAQARGANILAEVVGYGATSDAYHITSPCEDGEGAARAMVFAMDEGRNHTR